MTVCNMSIECGARGGMIAPDQTTFDYLRGRERAPQGAAFDEAVARWRELYSDADAVFDREYRFDAADIAPMITYGTNPGMGMAVDADDSRRRRPQGVGIHGIRMPAKRLLGKPVDYVFVGSCTNGRIEDLRRFARLVEGRRKADNMTAWIVPGSKGVEAAARAEGLDRILAARGIRTPPAGLFGLSGDERRQDSGGQILRFDLEPQFRRAGRVRAPGRCCRAWRWPPPPLADGRDRRPARRCSICKRSRIMSIPKFVTFTSGAVPVEAENIDTDQIIPARFLKATERKGFGDNLFRDWRYDAEGRQIASFPLNDPPLRGAAYSSPAATSAAAVRANMPPGPSPTTASASWCRVSSPTSSATTPSTTACCRSRVSDDFLAAIFADHTTTIPQARFTVDLESADADRRVRRAAASGSRSTPTRNAACENGYDDVDYLRSISDQIRRPSKRPENSPATMLPPVEIMDTTLRDGEQTSGVSFNAREKLSIARLLLEELRVSRIEIASARVSQGEQEAVRAHRRVGRLQRLFGPHRGAGIHRRRHVPRLARRPPDAAL